MSVYRRCMRCMSLEANPVLCNQCHTDVKAEYQKLVEEISQYVFTREDLNDSTER